MGLISSYINIAMVVVVCLPGSKIKLYNSGFWLNPFPAVGPETGPPNHMIATRTARKRTRLVFMIVTRTAQKRAHDTSFYRALLTSAVANYKVSTYQVCSNEVMIFLSMVCIYWFFPPGFFSHRQ